RYCARPRAPQQRTRVGHHSSSWRTAGPPPFPYTTLFRSPVSPPGIPFHQEQVGGRAQLLAKNLDQPGVPLHRHHPARGPEELLRSEEHTSELQSRENLVCRLLLEKKNQRA